MESQHLSVIRVWAALAWADGVIAPSEAAAMTRLIEGSAELSDDERKVAKGFLNSKIELDTTQMAGLSAEAREGIYRAAARLAHIDNDFAEAEQQFLERLRAGLSINEATAKKILESIPPPKKK
jgi:uncharacterized membrane protein YebE (DUF533 family)